MSAVSNLMNSLLVRYKIPSSGPDDSFIDLNECFKNEQPSKQLNNKTPPDDYKHKYQRLLEKYQELQMVNQQLNAKLEKNSGVQSKDNSELTDEREQANEQRIAQLQSINEALQNELVAVKDLLREQEALIIQMHSSSNLS